MMLGIEREKEKQTLGLRTTKDEEFTIKGDVNVIKNLQYRFRIGDTKASWNVQGKGNQLTSSYAAKPHPQADTSSMVDEMGIDYHKLMRIKAVYKKSMDSVCLLYTS